MPLELITILCAFGIASLILVYDHFASQKWLTRIGRHRYCDNLGELPAGNSIWAWRHGAFVRAKTTACKEAAEQDEPADCHISFEDDDGKESIVSSALIRKGSDQPNSLCAHKWHRIRRMEILKKHPEIKKIKPLPKFVYPIILIVAITLHFATGLSIALGKIHPEFTTWMLGIIALTLAATTGAFFAYTFQQITHEIAHTPKGGSKLMKLLAIGGDIMVGTSGPNLSLYYFTGHKEHHNNTGDDGDPDYVLHSHWATLPKWATGSRLGRLSWITLFGLFTFEFMQIEHWIGRYQVPHIQKPGKKILVLVALKYAFMAATFWFGGIWCFLYFKLAGGFAMGAFGHPYSGFWLMQHLSVPRNGYQPTVSYGGSWIWNWLTFGELYHVEHHDFPWIPFTRIYQVRRAAPEYYESLWVVPSVCRLSWEWISHTDGTPWMEVAGALDSMRFGEQRDSTHRPAPEIQASS